MASVRKREWTHKGEVKSAWILTYADQGGKRRQKTFPRKKDAEAYRVHVEGEIEQGVHTAINESIKYQDAAEAFLQNCERRQKIGDMTRAGLEGYRYKLEHYAGAHFSGKAVASISQQEVQDFVDELCERYSPATVSGTYTAIVALFTFCVKKRWMRRNILKDDPCRLPKRPKRKAIPSKDDLRALMKAAANLEYAENKLTFVNRQVFVTCGVFGGFRPGESFGLQWEDIDWEKDMINVQHSHTRMDGLKAPKTENGIRKVPLSEPIKNALMACAQYWTVREWADGPGFRSYNNAARFDRIAKAWEQRALVVDPRALSGFVIVTKVGKPMTATASATTFWTRLMKSAGLYDLEAKKNKFTPHALRHAAASLMIERGLDDMNLMQFIGHASISTTKDIYGHIMSDDDRVSAASAAIADELGATRERQRPVSR